MILEIKEPEPHDIRSFIPSNRKCEGKMELAWVCSKCGSRQPAIDLDSEDDRAERMEAVLERYKKERDAAIQTIANQMLKNHL